MANRGSSSSFLFLPLRKEQCDEKLFFLLFCDALTSHFLHHIFDALYSDPCAVRLLLHIPDPVLEPES